MVARMPFAKSVIFCFGGEQGFHPFHFKFHFDIGRQLINHFLHGITSVFFCVQRRADSREKMRIIGINDMFIVQFQCADKRLFQLRKKMKRAAQKGNMSADWFPAGEAADGLVDNRLKNGSG